MSEAIAEMPRYQSHKIVHALKIQKMEEPLPSGHCLLHPAEVGYKPIFVGPDWMSRCHATAKDHGYYVVYEDGYTSWSPTKAFEDGYTRI